MGIFRLVFQDETNADFGLWIAEGKTQILDCGIKELRILDFGLGN